MKGIFPPGLLKMENSLWTYVLYFASVNVLLSVNDAKFSAWRNVLLLKIDATSMHIFWFSLIMHNQPYLLHANTNENLIQIALLSQ